ncbi:cytochrome P450 [Streptomyces sp. NPDC049555]|uniref:cytochrome P450 n=1 Tax=Streptomyces sp. NPDC049555 TaxID=3154930 RepID=UPI0034499458
MTATGSRATAPSAAPAFPQDRTCPYAPPAGYADVAAGGPVTRVTLYDGSQVWAVTGHAEARAVLADRRFSSDRQDPHFPVVVPRVEQQATIRTPLLGVDDPRHAEERRPLIPHFGHRTVAALRPRIQEIVDGLIDAMLAEGPGAELVSAYSLPVPSMVICHLLGVPYADHEYFEGRSRELLAATTSADAVRARNALLDYLRRLVEDKERRPGGPGPGLLGELIEQGRKNGGTDRDQLVLIALILLVAGHETTSNMIALGTYTLLRHPDQLAALRADPALMPGAVEELLRYLTIADVLVRVATDDVELGGRTIKAGDGVIVIPSLANRDTAVYPGPETLDVSRSARHHLAFGFGPHQCLGQNLARAEMEIALSTLFARIPTLRLAVGPDELPAKPGGTLQGLYSLPVTW